MQNRGKKGVHIKPNKQEFLKPSRKGSSRPMKVRSEISREGILQIIKGKEHFPLFSRFCSGKEFIVIFFLFMKGSQLRYCCWSCTVNDLCFCVTSFRQEILLIPRNFSSSCKQPKTTWEPRTLTYTYCIDCMSRLPVSLFIVQSERETDHDLLFDIVIILF